MPTHVALPLNIITFTILHICRIMSNCKIVFLTNLYSVIYKVCIILFQSFTILSDQIKRHIVDLHVFYVIKVYKSLSVSYDLIQFNFLRTLSKRQ